MPFLHKSGQDKVIFRFSRYPLTGFGALERSTKLPPLSRDQIGALDAVQFVAAANSVSLPMGKGAIVFINDMAMLHARQSFRDDVDQVHRHLLKMYLRDPEQSWGLPETAKQQWLTMYGPNREDGARQESWPIEFQPGQEGEAPTNG